MLAATAVTPVSTSAVSRLHKLIPVYIFYSYWRIKISVLLNFTGSDIFKITENKTRFLVAICENKKLKGDCVWR